jgi:hypothetical protein
MVIVLQRCHPWCCIVFLCPPAVSLYLANDVHYMRLIVGGTDMRSMMPSVTACAATSSGELPGMSWRLCSSARSRVHGPASICLHTRNRFAHQLVLPCQLQHPLPKHARSCCSLLCILCISAGGNSSTSCASAMPSSSARDYTPSPPSAPVVSATGKWMHACCGPCPCVLHARATSKCSCL